MVVSPRYVLLEDSSRSLRWAQQWSRQAPEWNRRTRRATYVDIATHRCFVLVWKIDIDDDIPTLRLICAEHVE